MAQNRVTNLIWANQAVPVVFEVDPRIIGRDHENRESRSRFLDRSQFPISQDRIHRAIPRTAIGFTFAEGQLINYAGGEIMIQVDLRQAPVQLLPSRQGIISRA